MEKGKQIRLNTWSDGVRLKSRRCEFRPKEGKEGSQIKGSTARQGECRTEVDRHGCTQGISLLDRHTIHDPRSRESGALCQ